MTVVLFFTALGLSGIAALLGTLAFFLMNLPAEGEEVIPWSEFERGEMTDEEIVAKLESGVERHKLHGVERLKYLFSGEAFPSAFLHQFLTIFPPCFLVALSMIYIVKYAE